MTRRTLVSLASFVSTAALASPAFAQSPPSPPQPSETLKVKPATTGKTDVVKGSFAASARPDDDDPTHVNDVSIAAGGLLSAGNAKTVALTSAIKTRIRRDEHQFAGAAAANFARAGKKGEPFDTTVENYQGIVRYDYFLTNDVSLFLQTTGRRDRFQGLDLRLNFDPGVAYYFLATKKHRLQAEAGYDLQHDVRRNEDLQPAVPASAPAGTPPPPALPKTQTLHNLRLYVGYENKLRKEVAFISGVEYLQNFADLETYRLIVDVGLKSTVADRLALAATYTARYENQPLPNVEPFDSIAAFTLVYTLF